MGANLRRTTVWIHRVELVKNGRVQNMGGVKYKKVDDLGKLHITVPKNRNEEKGGGERGKVKLSRWITLWFAPDRITRMIWRS